MYANVEMSRTEIQLDSLQIGCMKLSALPSVDQISFNVWSDYLESLKQLGYI